MYINERDIRGWWRYEYMMYYVYRIEVDKKTRYVGFTQDIIVREKQHNYLCFKKRIKKDFYNKVRELYPNMDKVVLNIVKTFPTKIDAKRFECYLILSDYFTKKELWQRVPRIADF